jgi:hypothetical protein
MTMPSAPLTTSVGRSPRSTADPGDILAAIEASVDFLTEHGIT